MLLKTVSAGMSAAARRGLKSLEAGDLRGALMSFRTAVRNEPGLAEHRHRLALVEDALGAPEIAVRQLSWALALKPAMEEPAAALSAILSRGKVPLARIRPDGFRAALGHRNVDRDVLAAATLAYLSEHTALRDVLALAQSAPLRDVARALCLERTQPILRDALFHRALASGVVARPDVENLLTAIRRFLLLELPRDRRSDPKLREFMTALLQQMWCNEFCWAEADDETSYLDQAAPDIEAAFSGDNDAEWRLLCQLLYRPIVSEVHDAYASDGLTKFADPHFKAVLAARLEHERQLRGFAFEMVTLASPGSEISVSVAGQYEHAPYPRWTAMPIAEPRQFLDDLASRLPPGRMDFTREAFDVLIAGCGTGKQAVSGAIEYGPNARVLGIDISRTSLGYAAVMARQFGVDNLTLAIGDIDRLDTVAPSMAKRFKIIECAGVMHHMPDLFRAWRKLLACLADDGVMFVALYSGLARSQLQVLRGEPEFPGPAANDAALRRYRQHLMTRLDSLPHGKILKHSRDFHSASGFRDYLLHVHETTTTLPEIAAFLDREGLAFHGFAGPPIDVLRARFPGELAPGSLARWAEIEAASPTMFAGMYQFWVSKARR